MCFFCICTARQNLVVELAWLLGHCNLGPCRLRLKAFAQRTTHPYAEAWSLEREGQLCQLALFHTNWVTFGKSLNLVELPAM